MSENIVTSDWSAEVNYTWIRDENIIINQIIVA